ncbi:hypothetical protein ACWDSJ_28070 [Nocardia sp. NPDC003482]
MGNSLPAVTAQGRYYAALGRCEREGDHERVAELRADGPPPAEPRDGLDGMVAYYRHRAAQGDEDAALFVRRHSFGIHASN